MKVALTRLPGLPIFLLLLAGLGLSDAADNTLAVGKTSAAAEVQRLLQGAFRSPVTALHAMGKAAIPDLIAAIDTDSGRAEISFDLQNPISSYLPNALLDTLPVGYFPAYVIELILGVEDLRWNNPDSSPGMFPHGMYIYEHGLLYRKVDDTGLSPVETIHAQDRVLTMAEMREVKALYEKWWYDNQEKPLATLREGWRAGHRPLSGSAYGWW